MITPTVGAVSGASRVGTNSVATIQLDGDPSTFSVALFYANKDGSKGKAVTTDAGSSVVLSSTYPAITFFGPAYIYYEKQASAGFPFGLFTVPR